MTNALIVDYFGTIADPRKVDRVLKPLATQDSFRGIYKEGAQKALEKILKGEKTVIEAVRNTFYHGVPELFQMAQMVGLDTQVYSAGHGQFIITGLGLLGVETGFLDPDEIGDKKQAKSYQTLREKTGYRQIIFATDSNAEVRAAVDGGIDHVVLVDSVNPDYLMLHDLIEGIR